MKLSFKGLTSAQVTESRAKHGTNAITPQETEGFFDKLFDNMKDPTIIILMVALVVITVLAVLGYAHWYEGVGIAAAVVVATGVATWSEYKNEGAFQKLLAEASRIRVKVFRDGTSLEVPSDDLVMGDHVLLQPGDKVPADGFVLAGELKVDQASLTGEADSVPKSPMAAGQEPPLTQDLTDPHWAFRGSVVVDGEAVLKLAAVGDRTVYGKLAQEMQSADRESPLQAKLTALAEGIGKFGTIGAIFIAVAFMYNKLFMADGLTPDGLTLDTFVPFVTDSANLPAIAAAAVNAVILAIIIVVVAVPEGLPMMIAIVLSINMRKLLADKVLVRKLLGIEAAGSLNILFTDKTGTLTRGELQVSTFVTGTGEEVPEFGKLGAPLGRLVGLSIGQNTSAVIDFTSTGALHFIGADRTEQALLRFAEPALRNLGDAMPVELIPFNSERKFSAARINGGEPLTLVKGAPELILPRCTHYHAADGTVRAFDTGATVESKLNSLAERSMRLLALATSTSPLNEDKSLPSPLTLVGVVGLRDELRTESRGAVGLAHQAGIQVVMVTGDRRETAQAIGKDVGLLQNASDIVLTADQVEAMSDEELKRAMPKMRVVARAFPHQKSRLVRLAQELGLVGGMTGDGVNDAGALKRSDVGFAMGSGTEVAKEAGDIVILDDNFRSLTRSVLYGRTLFKSIRKFLIFQLTVNVSAILLAFLGPFFGFDLPLTMIQLLWINLIMDTLAALAFSGEAALERYMKEPPIAREAPLISGDMWSAILYGGVVTAALSIFFLTSDWVKSQFVNEAHFLTGFFGFFVFMHNFNKFNARTDRVNLLEHIADNKGFLPVVGLIFVVQFVFTYIGGDMLRTVGLTLSEWLLIIGCSVVVIPLDLLRKTVRNALGYSPDRAQT